MKWARCSTLTESICSTAVRARVRLKVRIVGTVCRGSRNPCATSATRRACARDRDATSLTRPSMATPTDRWGSGDVQQLLPDGVHDGLHPGVQLELLQDVPHVVLHGVLADEQPLGDLPVVQALGDQLEDLELTLGEPRGRHLLPVRAGHLLELVEELDGHR